MDEQKRAGYGLRSDISVIVANAIAEYDMSPGEIAKVLREKADWVEEDR